MVDFTLPEPIRVLVTDREGQPVAGSIVYFRTASQPDKSTGFSCHPEIATTDSAGYASCKVTLGSVAGNYQVLVRTQGNIQGDTSAVSF